MSQTHINRFSATSQGNDNAKEKTLRDIDLVLRGIYVKLSAEGSNPSVVGITAAEVLDVNIVSEPLAITTLTPIDVVVSEPLNVNVSNPQQVIGITYADNDPLEVMVSAIVPIEIDNVVEVEVNNFPSGIGVTTPSPIDVNVQNNVKLSNKYLSNKHYDFNVYQENDLGSGYYLIQPTEQIFGDELGLPNIGSNMSFVSTSANDTAAGTGAQRLKVEYYDGFFDEIDDVSTAFVDLSGTTPTPPLAIYRIKSITVVGVGILGSNEGTITLFITGTFPIEVYPGSIPPNRNKWVSSHIFIPQRFNTYPNSKAYIDYVNYHIEKGGGSDSRVRVYQRNAGFTPTPWLVISEKLLVNDFSHRENWSNYELEDISYDLIWTYGKDGGGGEVGLGVQVGLHIEQ